MAKAGLEMALWDLAGKILNRPVCQLMGGPFRDAIPMYSHGGCDMLNPASCRDWAQRIKEQPEGFTAFKVGPDRLTGVRAILAKRGLAERMLLGYPADKLPNKATVDRAGLLAAVRAASLITTQDSKAVRLAFAKGGLTVTSSSPETGEAALQVDTQYEGEGVEIAFNPDYITAFLRCIEDEKVSVEMSDASKAALFSTGPEYRYVLMPITGPA